MKRGIKIILFILSILLLFSRFTHFAPPEKWLGVVVEAGQDPLRTAEYRRGIELIARLEGNMEVRELKIKEQRSGILAAKKFSAKEGCIGIMTTLDYPERFAPYDKIPVLTTGRTQRAISMRADEQDEVEALLNYAEQTGFHSLRIMVPEDVKLQEQFRHWLPAKWHRQLLTYEEPMLSTRYEFDKIVMEQIEALLIWGSQSQVPRLITALRHSGYTGIILGPSYLEEYETMGINEGQATGIFLAAQYLNPKQLPLSAGVRQQQFIRDYTKYFSEAPLFAESCLGADQMLLFSKLNKIRQAGETPLQTVLLAGELKGIVQMYDYHQNSRTGNVNMVIYEIRSGHIEEAR